MRYRIGEHLMRERQNGSGFLPDVDGYVLVVEDDPVLRSMVLEVLREDGFHAEGVADGLPALHLAVRRCPSVILLDLGTPDLDGESFARLYHRLPGPHAPLVLMTGAADADDLAKQVGAAGVLSKPFDLAHLVAVAERYVTRAAPVAA
jgi:CheY-like chemotaxis protein